MTTHFRRSETLRVLLCSGIAAGGGFLLSNGQLSGTASPLAAALAGVCSPFYACGILIGTLAAYVAAEAPAGMHYLLTCLVFVTCTRILFRENDRPHALGILTALSCSAAGFALDLVFYGGGGKLPLYLLEAMLTGMAAYFIADAAECLRRRRRIPLGAGKNFTFALCYLLLIAALCGLDTPVCNPGRIAGIAVTLLCARQLRQNGGTLCGALTACGAVLCSVPLGTPLLFLPVTAMLAGFLYALPNALYIPVFFLMQMMSSAVLDGSAGLLKVMTELVAACMLYALCSRVDLRRYLLTEPEAVPGQSDLVQREQFLGNALLALREEASAVMRHLPAASPAEMTKQMEAQLCADCKNLSFCRRQKTEKAFRELLHEPRKNPLPPPLESCIRQSRLRETAAEIAHRNALHQMQRVHLMQDRAVTMEYLHLLEEMTSDAAARRSRCCAPETQALQSILRRCACEEASCFVSRLRSGRYAAEIYTKQSDFPLAGVEKLFSRRLGVPLSHMLVTQKEVTRLCLYETPPYSLEHAVHSVNAPSYERCGDCSDAFTDGEGNHYLVLSDGMGSGSTASLASRIAVRTFRQMVSCAMPPETAIRLVNTMLLTETNTENFATLDVLILHADSGEVTLYKSGAAATLLYRAGQMQCIHASSFPVGIVPDAMPARKHLTVMPEDILVMLSDGISEAEYPYIRQLLGQGMPLKDAALAVCDKAAIFHGGTARDDMTVIAAKVCSRYPARETVPLQHAAQPEPAAQGVMAPEI